MIDKKNMCARREGGGDIDGWIWITRNLEQCCSTLHHFLEGAIIDKCRTVAYTKRRDSRGSYQSTRLRGVELGIAKVHLRMLLLKLFEHITLSLLIAGWESGGLLTLVVHHFLDHTAGLPV
jgi:hypothetical protein